MIKAFSLFEQIARALAQHFLLFAESEIHVDAFSGFALLDLIGFPIPRRSPGSQVRRRYEVCGT